jgi:hypothetical protein
LLDDVQTEGAEAEAAAAVRYIVCGYNSGLLDDVQTEGAEAEAAEAEAGLHATAEAAEAETAEAGMHGTAEAEAVEASEAETVKPQTDPLPIVGVFP